MGASNSREGHLSDSDSDLEEEYIDEKRKETSGEEEEEEETVPRSFYKKSTVKGTPTKIRNTDDALGDVDARLASLKLKYTSSSASRSPNPKPGNGARLYLHVGGNTPNAKWIISDKLVVPTFVKSSRLEGEDDEDDDDDECEEKDGAKWILKIGRKIRILVGPTLQFKTSPEERRVDFVADGVWALKFFTDEGYRAFSNAYQNCSFENIYGMEDNDASRAKIFGKDFIGWANPQNADDSIWEDAEDSFQKSPSYTPVKSSQGLLEEFEETSNGGIQSLTLGALDNSFLVSDSGIQVVKNFSHGIHGKGSMVKFAPNGNSGGIGNSRSEFSTPKKGLLMRAETNMLLMSPAKPGVSHSTGVHQLDIETGKVVTEWKFGKDGADITMTDITNDSKGAQLDPSESTFLGLDTNRLCRWDMRDRRGIVQDLASSAGSAPVLQWAQGHQFSRGTNFQCFASTGDGSIVVGSIDGKIRLYSKSSMRMAKTAFPGLGSPITHVDVTFDGKWILGTTDTYLILISTVFKDKDGKEKTGFSGRMGNRIAAPRLLKLNPVDSHLAGVNNKFHGGQFSWVSL